MHGGVHGERGYIGAPSAHELGLHTPPAADTGRRWSLRLRATAGHTFQKDLRSRTSFSSLIASSAARSPVARCKSSRLTKNVGSTVMRSPLVDRDGRRSAVGGCDVWCGERDELGYVTL